MSADEPLPDSYVPLGQPPAVSCEDDTQLERWTESPGIYWNGEVNEGPPWV